MITDWAREQILKALRTSVVKKLTAEKWPVLGLAGRTAEIETALIADVQAPLQPYGSKITRLGNMTISLSPEDEQTLKGLRKDTAYTRLAGGFREYGVGAALKGIGEGAAAGGGNGAAALGMGMGLGGMVGGIGLAPNQSGGQNPGGGVGPRPGAGPGGGAGGNGLRKLPRPERTGREILLQLRRRHGAARRALHPMRHGCSARRKILRQLRRCADLRCIDLRRLDLARRAKLFRCAGTIAALCFAASALARTGGGSHAAVSHSSSSGGFVR